MQKKGTRWDLVSIIFVKMWRKWWDDYEHAPHP